MAAVKSEPLPTENADGLDNNRKQNAIVRALLEAGGKPKNFTKATVTKVGVSGCRVNIFAKEPNDITARIVFSTFLTV